LESLSQADEYSRPTGHNITLVVVEAVNGDVFGGLATDRWQVSSKYYGSGNSFLFRIGLFDIFLFLNFSNYHL
jgi:hypothetical protein